jgi:hypothetical protein
MHAPSRSKSGTEKSARTFARSAISTHDENSELVDVSLTITGRRCSTADPHAPAPTGKRSNARTYSSARPTFT